MPALEEVERIVTKDGLEKYLERLIAEKDGVRPEDVTEEYIRSERERRIYPRTRFDINSGYGGYDTRSLEVMTRDELKESDDRVTRAMEALRVKP